MLRRVFKARFSTDEQPLAGCTARRERATAAPPAGSARRRSRRRALTDPHRSNRAELGTKATGPDRAS